jgi:hypothetical protein
LDYQTYYVPLDLNFNNISNIFFMHAPSADGLQNTDLSSSTTPTPKNVIFSVSQDNKNVTMVINKETLYSLGSIVKDHLPEIPNNLATGFAGLGGASAGAQIAKNLPVSPLAKVGIVSGTAAATTFSTTLAQAAGVNITRNFSEFTYNQVVNSGYNKSLPEGRAPSPHSEFNINSVLDNLESNN